MNAGRELVYLSRSTLPSGEANAVHVVHMADAFARQGVRTWLRAARGEGDIATHYGIAPRFTTCHENALTHGLWMTGRWVTRRAGAPTHRLYYGRRLPAICALGRWGLPSALELHHPPRTAKQRRALQGFIQSRGFLGLVVISARLKDALLAQFGALAPGRVLVAHDGYSAARLHPPREAADAAPGTALRAVYCGSLHPGKGADAIVAAARLCPEVQFTVIGGDAAQVGALRATAPLNLSLSGRLPHAEVQRLLPTFDIALAPYGRQVRGAHTPAHENLADWMSPLKLFEYVAAGLPVITSDLPVLHELLADGVDAVMVEPDQPALLAAAINRLANDAPLRLRLAQSAQQRLREYTWEARAARILAFLDAALERWRLPQSRGARRP